MLQGTIQSLPRKSAPLTSRAGNEPYRCESLLTVKHISEYEDTQSITWPWKFKDFSLLVVDSYKTHNLWLWKSDENYLITPCIFQRIIQIIGLLSWITVYDFTKNKKHFLLSRKRFKPAFDAYITSNSVSEMKAGGKRVANLWKKNFPSPFRFANRIYSCLFLILQLTRHYI